MDEVDTGIVSSETILRGVTGREVLEELQVSWNYVLFAFCFTFWTFSPLCEGENNFLLITYRQIAFL